jgi:hypothetical protein
MTLTRYIDRRNNMKISKIAVAAIFAAGFVSVPTTLVIADTREQDDLMVIQCINEYTEEEGYKCIDTTPEEGVEYTTEEGDVDVKPIDSCWTTEDGSEVCARGLMEPMPANGEEVPVDGGDCTISTDPDGNELKACYDAVPYEVPGEEGEGVVVDDGTVDETLMFQSGVTKSGATPNDQTASSALAAFGVLVGALGALGIGISRQRAAKK